MAFKSFTFLDEFEKRILKEAEENENKNENPEEGDGDSDEAIQGNPEGG